MPTSFPGAVDAFDDPAGDALLSAGPRTHSQRHKDLNDAVEAIETAVIDLIDAAYVVDVASLATGGAGTYASPYTGWTEAMAALIADNTEFLFRGWFSAGATNFNFDSTTSVTLRGLDGHLGQVGDYNSTPGGFSKCGIKFTANGPNISARNSQGFKMEGLRIENKNVVDFVSTLVDVGSILNSDVSLGFRAKNVCFDAAGGTGSGNPHSCIKLDGSVESTLEGCLFYGAKYGVAGLVNNLYATAVVLRDCRFHSQTQVPILNPHMQWLVEACVFEPMAGGSGKWVKSTYGGYGAKTNDITFLGCFQWDTAGGGDVLDLQLADNSNWRLIACTTESVGGTVVKLANGCVIEGLTLIGNSFQCNAQVGTGSLLFPNGGTWSVRKASISGNIFGSGIDNLEAAVSGGQIVGGAVVDSAGSQLLPSRQTVGEQRIVSLVATANAETGGGKWSRTENGLGTASFNSIFNGGGPGPADGDYIEYKVFLPKGTYTLDFASRQGTDQGRIQLSIDGVDSGAVFELYNAAAGTTLNTRTGIVIPTTGVHLVRMRVSGKHASSTNYYTRLGLQWVFTRTA